MAAPMVACWARGCCFFSALGRARGINLQGPAAGLLWSGNGGTQETVAHLRSRAGEKLAQAKIRPAQELVQDQTEEEDRVARDVISYVNKQIEAESYGRLFAIIYVAGMQRKVTSDDLLVVQSPWPPEAGERIRFEKVLLVGSRDFTLIGRPLLPKDLVRVEATVVEKTLSRTLSHFFYIQRTEHQKMHRYRYAQTMLRINSVELTEKVGEVKDVEGLKDRIL